jgi:hypothetical protein
MLQPLKTKRVISLAILRDWDLLIIRDVGLFVLSRDIDASFVDNKRWGRIPSSADTLDNYNLLAIA